MNGIKKIIENAKLELKEARKINRHFFDCSSSDFKELFTLNANILLSKRNNNLKFIVDESNKNVINQLFYYFIGSEKFNGDLNKGIFLGGTLGTGKTLLMKSFCNTWNSFGKTIITQYTSREAADLIIKRIPRFVKYEDLKCIDYLKAPIYIDDIGKEPLKVNYYGTEICPMNDLLSKRYDKFALTFITGNYTIKTLGETYNETISNRMIEMFNVIALKGESRRK